MTSENYRHPAVIFANLKGRHLNVEDPRHIVSNNFLLHISEDYTQIFKFITQTQMNNILNYTNHQRNIILFVILIKTLHFQTYAFF